MNDSCVTAVKTVTRGDGQRCITVKQPWAALIISGVKRVENRSWTTKYRGRLWIHAGRSWDARSGRSNDGTYPMGALLGRVELVDVVTDSTDEFAQPWMYHWVLANPFPVEPIPMRGKQGLWTLPKPAQELELIAP